MRCVCVCVCVPLCPHPQAACRRGDASDSRGASSFSSGSRSTAPSRRSHTWCGLRCRAEPGGAAGVAADAPRPRGLGDVSARVAEEGFDQSLDSVQADVTSVCSAILRSKNITFRAKAPGQAARSSSSKPPLPPPRGGVASPVAPRRRMAIATNERDQIPEENSLEPSCCCIDVLQLAPSTMAAGDDEAGSKSGRQMHRSI